LVLDKLYNGNTMQFLRNLFTLSKNVIIDDDINQNIFYILLNIDIGRKKNINLKYSKDVPG
jgi:hypothetical protein